MQDIFCNLWRKRSGFELTKGFQYYFSVAVKFEVINRMAKKSREKLPGSDGSFGPLYSDGASDNAHAQYPWESFATDTASGAITSTVDVGPVGWNYEGIQRANYFLDNTDKVTVIDKGLLDRYKAEVRFLRAFSYFNLLSRFGAVPLLTHVVTIGEENVLQTSKADLLKFVLDELDVVSKILPQSYGGDRPMKRKNY